MKNILFLLLSLVVLSGVSQEAYAWESPIETGSPTTTATPTATTTPATTETYAFDEWQWVSDTPEFTPTPEPTEMPTGSEIPEPIVVTTNFHENVELQPHVYGTLAIPSSGSPFFTLDRDNAEIYLGTTDLDGGFQSLVLTLSNNVQDVEDLPEASVAAETITLSSERHPETEHIITIAAGTTRYDIVSIREEAEMRHIGSIQGSYYNLRDFKAARSLASPQ